MNRVRVESRYVCPLPVKQNVQSLEKAPADDHNDAWCLIAQTICLGLPLIHRMLLAKDPSSSGVQTILLEGYIES